MAYQNYKDRMDESLGMRNGPKRNMKQSYKDRRDESYGMAKDFGHDKKPIPCDVYMAQKFDMGRMDYIPFERRGYPMQAWDYKY